MYKKTTLFYRQLNNLIFWKNYNLMKTDKDTKRVFMAVSHGIKQKNLKR